jgi:Respiratory-chain NADH dehydrogenase, 49 Kd subunit
VDLTGGWRRFALARPHLLLVQAPGGTAARLAVERLAREWGWPVVDTPADADLLVAFGGGGVPFDELLDQLWAAIPAPRWLVRLPPETSAEEAGAALASAREAMLERPDGNHHPTPGQTAQRVEANHATGHDHMSGAGGHGDDEAMHGDGHEMPGDGQAMHGDGQAMHGDGQAMHGSGQAMHGGGMALPGGLAMAGRAADRDGLQLDVLHVPLGPALPDWPAGLRLRLAMQGDVAQRVELDPLPAGELRSPAFWDRPWLASLAGEPVSVGAAERRRAAAHLDSLARLLRLAGLAGDARRCRRLRDQLLEGASIEPVQRAVAAVAARLRRSRLLRWSLDGLGVLDADAARRLGVTGPALRAAGAGDDLRRGDPAYPGFQPVVGGAGDVTARLLQWVAEVEVSLAMAATGASGHLRPVDGRHEGPRGVLGADRGPSAGLLATLPGLLSGLELAAVRLVVASLDPDLEELQAWRPVAVAHG